MNKIDIRRGDIHLLVAFEAIYREGTVTRASEKLHITQSTLSHALRRLRELFGDPLFERQGNVMAPTAMARSLIGPIQAGLGMLENSVRQIVPSQPSRMRRKLNIGMVSVDEAGFLPQLVARLDQNLGYDFIVSSYESGKFEARLAAGKFDLAIQPLAPHSEHIHRQVLTREGVAVVARCGHPAVKAGKLTLEDYMSQRHIVLAPGNLWSDMIDLAFQQFRLNRQVQVRCHDQWTACKIVATTDCLLTASGTAIGKVLEHFPENQLLAVPNELKMMEQEVYIYWHESQDNDPANQWLRDNLSSIYKRGASKEKGSKVKNSP
ncbi:LysR family transcriptional regulator [Denitratisoma oestradiolicum]|uniref:Putative PCP degradation transcriptional activation protein n=1 Tax=Denitratisoma oestradiolicum TaxID=311182 RepID=A0A6S6XYH1_9PROT|nr:LysR family transcriptional regulator [Denitratisoma oestradiolicum]TWO81220.1 hypothetical protein CBW56_06375 [Denitratisoma oestradiolicum]CAB1367919.1 putative PCP degradation transcriptional activation protein [Denitratisoma oestradiolicum]